MSHTVEHLYVHIPFCPKVCPYCSFYKEASDRNKTGAFVDAILRELDMRSTSIRLQPRTVFFGGGTPTALTTTLLERLIVGIRERIGKPHALEWTIEMNPATVSLEKARLLLACGVNRASMGIQSWNPTLLERLGRVHTTDQARRSYEILREAGFANINLDHIFGIPGQTTAHWVETLETSLSLTPEHLSAYCLTYEEDTEYFRRFQKGEWQQDEDSDAAFFELATHHLGRHSYRHYEVSNYARSGRECLHNVAYWRGHDYLGLGPSAFSTVAGHRWQNIPDTARYTSGILAGDPVISFEEVIDPTTRRAELIAFGLRMGDGISASLLADRADIVQELTVNGLLRREGNSLAPTRRGLLFADSLAEALM